MAASALILPVQPLMVSALHTGMMEVEISAPFFFCSNDALKFNYPFSFACVRCFTAYSHKRDEFVSFKCVFVNILLWSPPIYKLFVKVPCWETVVFNSILKKSPTKI